MGTRALAAVLLAAALAAASCTRSRGTPGASAKPATPPTAASTPTPATSPSPQAAAVQPVPRQASAAQPVAAPAQPAAAAQPVAAPAQPAAAAPPRAAPSQPPADSGVAGLLVSAPASPILPEDFLIGPLAAVWELQGDERAALSAAEALLASFARGAVERDLLAPASRESLAGSLAWAIERGTVPSSWRVGRPRRVGDEVAANLRLLGAGGSSAEGELFLVRTGEGWTVSDLQVNPADLAVARPARESRFFPSPYRWLLGE